MDRDLLKSLPTQIVLWSHDPGRTKGTWLPGNLPGQHPWRQGVLAGSCWGKMDIGSGKAVTAEAQGLCREASLSLRCPAALPPGNNKPLRNSYREFPLSSALLWDQQLDPSLLFSLNTVLNHMPSSSQTVPRPPPPQPQTASHSSGARCYSPISHQFASSDASVNSPQPTSAGTSPATYNFFSTRGFFSLVSLEICKLGSAYGSSSHRSHQGTSFQ